MWAMDGRFKNLKIGYDNNADDDIDDAGDDIALDEPYDGASIPLTSDHNGNLTLDTPPMASALSAPRSAAFGCGGESRADRRRRLQVRLRRLEPPGGGPPQRRQRCSAGRKIHV